MHEQNSVAYAIVFFTVKRMEVRDLRSVFTAVCASAFFCATCRVNAAYRWFFSVVENNTVSHSGESRNFERGTESKVGYKPRRRVGHGLDPSTDWIGWGGMG